MPLRLTVAVAFVDELLLTVSLPVTAPVAVGANLTLSVIACFGLRVTGKVAPLTLNPVPLMVAELTVTAPVPVEVSVTPNVAFEPVLTSPKLKLVGLTVKVEVDAVAVPVPLRETPIVACPDALLDTVIVPVAAPALVGANFALSVTVCLGLSVTGKVAPETVNPVPLIDAEAILTAAVPVEVSFNDSVEVLPTAMLPKLRLDGLTANCGVVAATPMPLRLTVTLLLLELLLIVSVPVAALFVVGANFTWSFAVCFGLSVRGNVAPDTLKAVPLIVAELILTAEVPVEVRVTDSVKFEPTVTVPKLRLVGLTDSVGAAAATPVLEITRIRQQAVKTRALLHQPLLRRSHVFIRIRSEPDCEWSR